MKNKITAEQVAAFLGGKKTGSGYTCRCAHPSHDDNNPSMTVTDGDDGKLLIYCHSRQCNATEILQELNRAMGNGGEITTPKPAIGKIKTKSNASMKFVRLSEMMGPNKTHYIYKNADGSECFRAIKSDLGEGKKTFLQISALDDGRYRFGRPDVFVIYNLPEVVKNKNSLVFVVEGEKDVDTLAGIGIVATTNSGSLNSVKDFDYSPLGGKSVCIWPDHDDTGEQFCDAIVKAVSGIDNRVITLRVIRPYGEVDEKNIAQDPNNKKDATDWIIEQREAGKDDDQIKQEILAMFQNAESVEDKSNQPEVISLRLPPVQRLDIGLLPNEFGRYCEDVANRAGSNVEYIAMGCLVTAATCLGSRIKVRPQRKGSWEVTPNMWGYVIGEPSQKKSSLIASPKKFLEQLEKHEELGFKDAKQLYDIELERFEQELRQHKSDPDMTTTDIHRWVKDNEPECPPRPQFVINEATPEALRVVMKDNPNGQLLYFRDEMSGLIEKLLDDPAYRAFMLEAWSGDASFTENKIARGQIKVDNLCMSIMGTIQPDVLMKYVEQEGVGAGDGFNQRFQLTVWPDPILQAPNDDEEDLMARIDAFRCFKRLAELEPSDIGATIPEITEDVNLWGDEITDTKMPSPYIRFSAEANELYVSWQDWQIKMANDTTIPKPMAAHIGKMPATIASLAMIIHICETPGPEVTRHAVVKAIKLCDFLLSHSNRLYNGTFNDVAVKAWELAKNMILTGEFGDSFTAYEIYRTATCGIRTKEEAGDVISVLEEHNWVVAEQKNAKTIYHINPGVHQLELGECIGVVNDGEVFGLGYEAWKGEKLELDDVTFDPSALEQKIAERNKPEGFHDEFGDFSGGAAVVNFDDF